MDKGTKKLLIGIVGAMLVLTIILIICVTLNDSKSSNDSTEVSSSEGATENHVKDFYEDISDSSSENSNETSTNEPAGNTPINYAEDIVQESQGVKSVLSLNGQDYTVPCQFSSFGNHFEYLETIPETLPAGSYQELHIVKDGVDTGVSLMVVNTTDKEIAINDAYVNFISISTSSDIMSASCIGLSCGSAMQDIKHSIESGGYNYESATYDYEQTFLVSISDSVTASITYDRDEKVVTKIVLEYAIN